MKQRIAPIHRRVANPPNSCLQNLIHSGVVLGGVSLFGPSRANISSYLLCVKPCSVKLVNWGIILDLMISVKSGRKRFINHECSLQVIISYEQWRANIHHTNQIQNYSQFLCLFLDESKAPSTIFCASPYPALSSSHPHLLSFFPSRSHFSPEI